MSKETASKDEMEVIEIGDEEEEEEEELETMEHDGKEDENEDDSTPNEEKNEDKTDGNEQNEEASKDPLNPTKRDGEFTSENFKIELRGLPRYFSVAQLKKLLNETLQLKAHKIIPAGPYKNWAYINFRDEKSKQKALVILDEYQWKKCTFQVSPASPAEDPLVKHMKKEEVKAKKKPETTDPDSGLSIAEKVTKSVTPYAHLPYEEQLKMKQKEALHVMRKFGTELARINPELVDWVHWQKLRRQGQVCEVDEIVPSPVTHGYRNKCEFTIGINPENNLPTVGFRVASYKEGSIHVGPVDHLCHLPYQMKKIVLEFEKFVRDSGLAPYSPVSHEGVWRQLNVRTTRNKDILIVPVIHPQEMSREELDALKKKIVEYFTEGPGQVLGITSIFFKSYGQKEPGDEDESEHLWGEEHIYETILDKRFRVSPEAFLQVNTTGAELLYDKIGELAELDGTSAILDICCGTGTIGISLAERCLKVYGIELVEKAADDARFNAEENGLENIVVFTGKAEENMPVLVQNCTKVNVVGIVDPPRAGLNGNVVFGLRKCDNMKHLVYVSCDPTVASKNFINLGRPQSKQYKGEFFIPLRAIPVDLFPHTPHYELVILFERWEERKWRRIMEGNPLPRDQEYFQRIPQRPKAGRDFSQSVAETPGYGEWKTVTADNRRQANPRFQPYQQPRPPFNQPKYEMGYDEDYDEEPFAPGYGHRDGPNQGFAQGFSQNYNHGFDEDFDEPINRPGAARQGFGRADFDRPGYERRGYDRPLLERPLLDRPLLDRPLLDRPLLNTPSYDRSPYGRPSYDRSGYNRFFDQDRKQGFRKDDYYQY